MLSGIALLFIFLHQPPEHQASARVSGLRLSATSDVTTPGFVLIVSLTISLWSYRSDRFDRSDRIAGRIVDRIALIALVALTVSLVVSLIASLWSIIRIISLRSPSGPRRNSLHSWITHLHPIIYQDPFTKPAGSSKVTSRFSILSQVEVDVDIPRVRLFCARLAIFSPLTRGSSRLLPGRAWVHSSCSTIINLERR